MLGLAWANVAHVAAPDGSIVLHSVGAVSGCSVSDKTRVFSKASLSGRQVAVLNGL